MSPITGVGGVTGTPPVQGTGAAKESEKTTGQGIGGGGDGADVTGSGAGVPTSLLSFFPKLLGGDFETRLAEITQKMREASGTSEQERLQTREKVKQLNIQENQAKMEEATQKLEEAAKDKETSSIWGAISKAFMALGALLTAAIGAVLIATGIGAAAGAVMIAASAFMVASLVNSIVAENSDNGMGILGQILTAAGVDEETAQGVDTATAIGSAVISAALSIAAAVMTFGIAAPGAAGAVLAVSNAVQAGTAAAGAVTGAVQSGYGLSAALNSGEAAELQADSKDIQAFMQQLDDIIDQALSLLMQANDRFNVMLDDITDMTQDTSNTLSAVRFSG